jgi:hypothetical protein
MCTIENEKVAERSQVHIAVKNSSGYFKRNFFSKKSKTEEKATILLNFETTKFLSVTGKNHRNLKSKSPRAQKSAQCMSAPLHIIY